MRRDDGLFAVWDAMQDGRDQVSQALADAGSGFDRQVLLFLQRPRDRHRHLLLLRPKFEISGFGKQSGRREHLLDSLDEVEFRTARLKIHTADHRRPTTSCSALFLTSM